LDYSLFKCKKEGLALIMESNQMFILMKNCTKIGLKLNKQMVGVTWIGMLLLGFISKFLKKV